MRQLGRPCRRSSIGGRAGIGHRNGPPRPALGLRAHGETALLYAARLQRLKTLDLLIQAGADPSIADSKGRDAVDIARARRLPKDLIDRLERARRRGQAASG